ncbi:DUF6932 family protein [Vibrio harveyi]|uniref:DUF6932 family protein n=1 Tax=Vibrio harveyi group TaxID=717610 RepID=UPI003AAEDE0D
MIPKFNASGVLPPYLDSDPTRDGSMSPYKVDLYDFVSHFATSVERKELLRGFLNYRIKMKSLGFRSGFQWVNGSFVENIEVTKGRPPADVDLVTFAKLPDTIQSEEDWDLLVGNNQDIFDNDLSKTEFYCDAFYVSMDTHPMLLIDQTRYWFGLFSHQRTTSLWKGIIEIDIDEDEYTVLDLVIDGGEDYAS